ncbi:probable inactive heme oxygenase 2, chloroplastic [Tanacetum coccineum]
MKLHMTSATFNLPSPPHLSIHNHSYPTAININFKLSLTNSNPNIRFPVLITNCINSTTDIDSATSLSSSSSSSGDVSLPPTVKKKRKAYRRMRPGETEGITEEMRFIAMKLREKKLKVKTDKSDKKESETDNDGDNENENENGTESDNENENDDNDDVAWEPELDGFLRYLVDSRFVFSTIERLVDESQDVSFAYFRNTGLERSESFTEDIEFISQQLTIPEPLFTSKKYVKYLEDLAAENPPLFFSHLYNIYFSHITGGQVIARKVSEKLLNGRELAICQWPGDPEVLLKNMREKLNALGQHWSRDEKNKCLKETSKSFMYMGTIIRLIIMR